MEFSSNRIIKSITGANLNLNVMEAKGKPVRAIVQINHGLAEHSARYARFADFLATKGFVTYAHDHRGHGMTTTPDAPKGSFGKGKTAQKVIDDVLAIHQLIATERPNVPVIIFGHSMGGLITMNFVQQHSNRIAAAAIWNSNFTAGITGNLAKLILAWEKFRLGSDVPSRILPKLSFAARAKEVTDGRTPFDWLSRDTSEVDLYVADPLCGWDANINLWQGVFDLIFAGADDSKFANIRRDLPFNLVGGENDPATDRAKATRALANRMNKIGFSSVALRIYPETRHESLNELNRDLVMNEFSQWLEKIIPRSGNA